MPRRETLSEVAQWFLEELQRSLDNFANEAGVQVVVTDKEGNLVNEVYGVQRVCKLIMANEDGKIRCNDHFKTAISLVKNQENPIFVECYAGFASVWIPIIVKNSAIGAIIACGGRRDKGESREKLEEKFSKLANDLIFMQKEDFIKAAIDEVPLVTEKEMQERAENVKELFDILVKTVHTPLKEIFG